MHQNKSNNKQLEPFTLYELEKKLAVIFHIRPKNMLQIHPCL